MLSLQCTKLSEPCIFLISMIAQGLALYARLSADTLLCINNVFMQ